MARNNKKKSTQSQDIWGDGPGAGQTLNRVPDEVPRARTIASKKSIRFRFLRILVWLCVISIPAFALMSLSMNNQMTGLRYDLANIPAAESVSSPGKSTAYVGMEEWLASDPAPLLGGHIISWDGFSNIDKPKQDPQEAKKNPLPDYELELHTFTLADANGNLFTSQIQIAVGPGNAGSVAVGTPSLEAVPPSATIQVTSPWFGFTRSAAPKPVTNSVSAWATAFTSGDPSKLLLAVGDSDPKHSYMPLYGVEAVSSEVSFASYIPPTGEAGEKYVQGQPTDKMIAQVKLTITWRDAPELEQGQRNTTVITYDILVTKADTASPQVVAWGGPGTGPTLEAFQNALTDNEIKTTDENGGSTFVDPSGGDDPGAGSGDEDGEEGTSTPNPDSTDDSGDGGEN